jgi:hypothetical protein
MKVEAMLWVVFLVSLATAILSRKYRNYGLAGIGLAVLVIVTVILLPRKDEIAPQVATSVAAPHAKRIDFEQSHVQRLDQEDPEAKQRIQVSQLRFEQISPSADMEPGTFESIRARLYNDSPGFALTDYGYYLAVQDCLAKRCTTIYDQRGLESAIVPAGQARDVKIEIRSGETHGSPPFKLLGTPKIILLPTETRAYNAAPTP